MPDSLPQSDGSAKPEVGGNDLELRLHQGRGRPKSITVPGAAKRRKGKTASDFPLWKHPSGRWTKKVCGRQFYFGKVADDPDGRRALDLWLQQKDDLLEGRMPAARMEGVKTLEELGFLFLEAKQAKVDTGELHQSTLNEYRATAGMAVKFLGRHRAASDVGPPDFATLRVKLAKGVGAVRLNKRIQAVRSLFKFGADNDYIKTVVKFGSEFKKVSAKVLRRLRGEKPAKLFTAAEVRALIDAAEQPLRCWVLLGINAGYGQTDLATLPKSAVDLKAGWIQHARPKTGAPRRCKLWPETLAALREALAMRPAPKNAADEGLCFLSIQGNRLVRFVGTAEGRGGWTDTIGKQFAALVKPLGMQQSGRRFYSLRHSFRTAADSLADRGAVDYVMGHLIPEVDMRGRYVHGMPDDERLKAVSSHVRQWLFAGAKRKAVASQEGK